MAIINETRLKQYLKLEYNVLFEGLHGIGKTSVIKKVFTEAFGERWKYFSASTLDPWVDLVGIPKGVEDANGKTTLELIRPSFIENDEVEAIMFDEFNRAPDKVINAVMELIQFKSINGHKLNNLKVIWAAINPEDDDDTYSVNHLDPAQIDRFQVLLKIPYKIDEDYFSSKYPATAPIFIQWWKDLPGDIQRKVSPRRVDYAADAHSKGCRLEDFLPVESNVSSLRKMLGSLPFHEMIKAVKDDKAAEEFIKDINNATKLLDLIKVNDSCAVNFFIEYGAKIPKELVKPFSEFVEARKKGFEVVSSVEELIEKLPNDRGNQDTAAMINNTDIDALYISGGSLENDLRTLKLQKAQLINKLSNRCADVMISCQEKTLQRIFWGLEGRAGNKPTNFHKIIRLLSKMDTFSPKQKSFINQKLYTRKIVEDMNYL